MSPDHQEEPNMITIIFQLAASHMEQNAIRCQLSSYLILLLLLAPLPMSCFFSSKTNHLISDSTIVSTALLLLLSKLYYTNWNRDSNTNELLAMWQGVLWLIWNTMASYLFQLFAGGKFCLSLTQLSRTVTKLWHTNSTHKHFKKHYYIYW